MDKIYKIKEGTKGEPETINGTAESIHRTAERINGAAEGIHRTAERINGAAEGIHRMAERINGMPERVIGMEEMIKIGNRGVEMEKFSKEIKTGLFPG